MKTERGHLYLIHAEATDLYKIGSTTRNPIDRLKELNGRQSPYELVLEHSIEVTDVQIAERYFHDRYCHFHFREEWFRFPAKDLQETLKHMQKYQLKYGVASPKSELTANKYSIEIKYASVAVLSAFLLGYSCSILTGKYFKYCQQLAGASCFLK